jgi:eukaryotic-like serine/threonine-protein kinase
MIQKLMAKKPDDRYQSFKEVLKDIARLRETAAGEITVAPRRVSGPSSSAALGTATESAVDVVVPAPRARGSNKSRSRMAIALIAVGILTGGATVRLIVHRLRATEPAANSAASEKAAPYVTNEERFKLDAVKNFADPGPSNEDLRRGLGFQVDLLAYYFKKGRLDDAEHFSAELQKGQYKKTRYETHPYQALGKLGHALVLAFRDQSEESLKQLGTLISVSQPARPGLGAFPNNQYLIAHVPSFLFESSELRRLIADALNRIAINLHVNSFEKYPQLDAMRKSPSRPFRPAAK